MPRKEIEQQYRKVCELTYSRQLKSALGELEKFSRLTTRTDYFYQLENFSENYRTLLRYAFEGYHDPQQPAILNRLCASMLAVADEVRQILLDGELPGKHGERKFLASEFGDDPAVIAARIEEMFFHRQVKKLIDEPEALPVTDCDLIFRQIWLTGKLPPEQAGLLRQINRSDQVEWHEKCLIVSALTLSALNHFDPLKIQLLTEFAEARQHQVWQRALTGIVLILIRYDRRLAFFPELGESLRKFAGDESVIPGVEIILMQLLIARETDKITREFEEEVLPEMKKMMPRIEDKLHLNDPSGEDDPEDKNPGWKDMIEEVPGLVEKIEKYSRMQMEGGDVFMSTFRLLKRFDFFNVMSNWFVPFHAGHPEIRSAFSGNDEISGRLIESLSKAFYICNSDKYSFAINFRAIPDQQRTMIVANFEAEFAQMQEMASEEQLLDQSLVSNSVFIQYIQDLYRFFKLYPLRHEFEDIFRPRIVVSSLNFYTLCFERTGFPEKVAAFHFDNEHYTEATDAYLGLSERHGPSNEYFEKIGYCYQKAGQYRKAIEFYRKAELFDANRLWLLKKLGWCSMKLNEPQQALGYYRDALSLQPDDVNLQMQAGQCLLLMKEYEQALQQYSRSRFFSPENLKVLRPLAWCQLAVGKLEPAAESYATILTLTPEPSAYDLLNAGHVQLCLGMRKEALNLYRQSLLKGSPSRNELLQAFDEDAATLVKNGIPAGDIPLIRDYLMFQTEQ